tara:strand:+ start:104 stop:271 length:168 start_codon:yes stop_codon:yes gene_type:complete
MSFAHKYNLSYQRDLCIAEHYAAICLESISNEEERKLVSESLTDSGHQIIDTSFE